MGKIKDHNLYNDLSDLLDEKIEAFKVFFNRYPTLAEESSLYEELLTSLNSDEVIKDKDHIDEYHGLAATKS